MISFLCFALFFVVPRLTQPSTPSDFIAFYDFAGNVQDSSLNNLHGAVFGNENYVSDRYYKANTAFFFDGSTCIDIGDNPLLRNVNGITVCFWYYSPPGGNAGKKSFFRQFDHGYGMNFFSENNLVSSHASSSSSTVVTDFQPKYSLSDGRWHHVCQVVDGNLNDIYHDGEKVASEAWGGVSIHYETGVSHSGWIGCTHCNSGVPSECVDTFVGAIDDVVFYGRALDHDEILSVFGVMATYEYEDNDPDYMLDSGRLGQDGLRVQGSKLRVRDRFGNPQNAVEYIGGASGLAVRLQSDLNGPLTPANGPLAMSLWFSTTYSGADSDMQIYTTGGYGWRIRLNFAAKSIFLSMCFDSGHQFYVDYGQRQFWNNGAWNHIAMSSDGYDGDIWFNGIRLGHVDNKGNGGFKWASSGQVFLGRQNSFKLVDTKVDNVKFFDRPLTTDEVFSEYRTFVCTIRPCNGIVTFFTFDAIQNSRSADSAGLYRRDAVLNYASPTSDHSGRIEHKALTVGDGTGVKDAIVPTGGSELYPTEELSVGLWFRDPVGGGGAERALVSSGASPGYYLFLVGTQLRCKFRSSPGGFYVEAVYELGDKLADGLWHHVACTTDGTNVDLYLDGRLVAFSEGGEGQIMHSLPSTTSIGSCNKQYFFNGGDIDDFFLYNSALDSTEIEALYGLVARYSFSGNMEDSGYFDIHGTNSGSASPTNDRLGVSNSAYTFDGTASSNIYLGRPIQLQPSDMLSIFAFIKTTSSDGNVRTIAGRSPNGYRFYVQNGLVNCFFRKNSAGELVSATSSPPTLADGAWHHVGCVMDGAQIVLYVDGVRNSVSSGGDGVIFQEESASEGVWIGSSDGFTGGFDGVIDDVEFYHRALSDEEVFKLSVCGVNNYYKEGRTPCISCPRHSSTEGASEMEYCICDADFFGTDGHSPCLPCPSDSSTLGSTGMENCICDVNFFGTGGFAPCLSCPPESTTLGVTGMENCVCNANFYGTGGKAPCLPCPPGSTTLGLTGIENCVCNANFYGTGGKAPCTECPALSSTLGIFGKDYCTCEVNSYGSEGHHPCTQCPAFSSTFGNNEMEYCICDVNSYGIDGHHPCTQCPTFSSTLGAIEMGYCICEVDSYGSDGHSPCTQCPAFSSTLGAIEMAYCICEVDSFGTNGHAPCTQCPLFSSTVGNHESAFCTCNIDSYGTDGRAPCTQCPLHSTTTTYGSSSIDDCLCDPGYLRIGDVCEPNWLCGEHSVHDVGTVCSGRGRCEQLIGEEGFCICSRDLWEGEFCNTCALIYHPEPGTCKYYSCAEFWTGKSCRICDDPLDLSDECYDCTVEFGPNSIQLGDFCYTHIEGGRTFADAETTCRTLTPHSHLASINNLEEDDFIRSVVLDSSIYDGEVFMIGLTALLAPQYSGGKNGWRFSDGSVFGYENFEFVSPLSKENHCVGITTVLKDDGITVETEGWRDLNCGDSFQSDGIICKTPLCGTERKYVCDGLPYLNLWDNVEWMTSGIECATMQCFGFCNFDAHECPEEFSTCFGLQKDDENVCHGSKCIFDEDVKKGRCTCNEEEDLLRQPQQQQPDCRDFGNEVDCSRWIDDNAIGHELISHYWNGNCYTKVPQEYGLNWIDAEYFCRETISIRSHLTSILSEEENEFIKSKFLNKNEENFYWIGLTANNNNAEENDFTSQLGSWQWSDGSAYEFMNWWSGSEPSKNFRWCGGIGNDNVVSIEEFGWGAVDCLDVDLPSGAICKTPSSGCQTAGVNRPCYDHDGELSPWDHVEWEVTSQFGVGAKSWCNFDVKECPIEYASCFGVHYTDRNVCSSQGYCIFDDISKTSKCVCNSPGIHIEPECLTCNDILPGMNSEYFPETNMCYSKVNNVIIATKNFFDAESYCRHLSPFGHSHLASITSPNEFTFISDTVLSPGEKAVIGLNSIMYNGASTDPTGNWIWSSGDPFNTVNSFWVSGEPNVAQEFCVVMGDFGSEVGWGDSQCTDYLHEYFVCQSPLCYYSCDDDENNEAGSGWDNVNWRGRKDVSENAWCNWENVACPNEFHVPLDERNLIECSGVSSALSMVCSGNGDCVPGTHENRCVCKQIFFGTNCEKSFTSGGYAYTIEDQRYDWISAQKRCVDERNGFLASIQNEAEALEIQRMITDFSVDRELGSTFSLWIGLNQIPQAYLASDGLTWSDGSMSTYWDGPDPGSDACVRYFFNGNNYEMQTVPCYQSADFSICKIPLDDSFFSNPWSNVQWDPMRTFCDFEQHSCPPKYATCNGKHVDDPRVCTNKNGRCRFEKILKKNYCECRNRWTGLDCEQCPMNMDPLMDCGGCRNNWYPPLECNQCESPPNVISDCYECHPLCKGTCSSQNLCDICPHGFQGQYCEESICSFGCPGTCVTFDTCDCPPGYLPADPVAHPEICDVPVCFDKTGINACNANSLPVAQGWGCVGDFQSFSEPFCSCRPGFGGKECEFPSFQCGGLFPHQEGVCSNRGECSPSIGDPSIGECINCREFYSGEFCELYKCNNEWLDSPNVCGGFNKSPSLSNTPCIDVDTCKCPMNDEQGFWDPAFFCMECLPGFEISSGCKQVIDCVGGEMQKGECVCYDDDINGHFQGKACSICKTKWFGDNCDVFCECEVDTDRGGITSGKCLSDGSGCVCYQDEENGWYSHLDPLCKTCLVPPESFNHMIFNDGWYGCHYGFYRPFHYIDFSPESLTSLFFSPDYDVLWGYFRSNVEYTARCEELLENSEICPSNSIIHVFPTNELYYGSGIYGTETIWMIEILGADLHGVGIDRTETIKINGNVGILYIRKWMSSFNLHGIQYDEPFPIIRSVEYEKEIGDCDTGLMRLRVYATNVDGTFRDLQFRVISTLPFPPEIGTWQDIKHFVELDKKVFSEGDNDLLIEVKNFFGVTSSTEITVKKVIEDDLVSLGVVGSGYYRMNVEDLSNSIGNVFLSYSICGSIVESNSLIFNNPDEGLHSLRVYVDDGKPLKIERKYHDFDRVYFFAQDFPSFGEEYVVTISVFYFAKELTQSIIVVPELPKLVLVTTTRIQSAINSQIIFDASASYDAAKTLVPQGTSDTISWRCSPACADLLLPTMDGDPFKREAHFSEMEPGEYFVTLGWQKGSRYEETEIVLELFAHSSEGEILFQHDLQSKKFCFEGTEFHYEPFNFYSPLGNLNHPNWMYYYERIKKGYVSIVVELNNAHELTPITFNFFMNDENEFEYTYERQMLVIDGYEVQKRTFSSRLGILDVYHCDEDEASSFYSDPQRLVKYQNRFKVHFKYLKDYLFPGDNKLQVNVSILTETESINAYTNSKFFIHPVELEKKVSLQRYTTVDNSKLYQRCTCMEDGHSPNCEVSGLLKLFTSFYIEDEREIVYEYDVLRVGLDKSEPVSHDGYSFNYATKESVESISVVLNERVNWHTLHLQRAMPFPSVCQWWYQEPITHDFSNLGDRIIAGSERVTLKSSKTGCVVQILEPIDMKHEPDILSTGSRRTVMKGEDFAFYVDQLPFDPGQKASFQKIMVILDDMYDEELTYQSDFTQTETMNSLFDQYVTFAEQYVAEEVSEIPSSNLYDVELKVMRLWTRAMVKGARNEVPLHDQVEEKLSYVLGKVDNMMELHKTFPEKKLLANSNLNLAFNVIENVGYVAHLLNIQGLCDRTENSRKIFNILLSMEYEDEYDGSVGIHDAEVAEQNIAVDFLQTLDMHKYTDSMRAQLTSGTVITPAHVEGMSRMVISQRPYSTSNTETPEDLFSDAVSSNHISISTGGGDIIQEPRDMAVAFQFDPAMLEGFNFYNERRSIVRPKCYVKDDSVLAYTSDKSGLRCRGVADFFHELSGTVTCNYRDVMVNNAEMMVRIEEFNTCETFRECSSLTACNSQVQINLDSISPAVISTGVTSTTIFGSGSYTSHDNAIIGPVADPSRRQGDTFFNSIRSVCINEHNGALIDTSFRLWLWGESYENEYFAEDTDIPYEIPSTGWGDFSPYSVHCTTTSIFVLALKGEDEGLVYGQVWAFGRTDDFEIPGHDSSLKVFTKVMGDTVVDIRTSPYALYVVYSDKDLSGRNIVEAIGRNPFGALGIDSDYYRSFGLTTVVLPTEVPITTIPKITPLYNGVFFEYRTSTIDTLYLYSGKNHPSTASDVQILTEIVWDRSIDFVQTLFDSCLYIMSEGRIFTFNDGKCGEMFGLSPPNKKNELVEIVRYGDFDPDVMDVFYFTCGFACYLIAQNEANEVFLFTFGQTEDGISLSANCETNCDRITLASTNVCFVVPGLGSSRVEQGSLIPNKDVFFFEMPVMKSVLGRDEYGAENFAPEIVWEQSGMEFNVLTITLKKKTFFGESDSEIYWTTPGSDYTRSINEMRHCQFPYFKQSWWSMWCAEEDGYYVNYFQISMDWQSFRVDCLWFQIEHSEEFDVYPNRLVFISHAYRGKFYGKSRTRFEVFYFDFNIAFPKSILSTELISKKEMADIFNFFIREKSFSRDSRTGSIVFSVISLHPNYLVFPDNAVDFPSHLVFSEGDSSLGRIGDILPNDPVYFKNIEVVEIGFESNDGMRRLLHCDGKRCEQEFYLTFEIVRDSRICSIPKTTIPINFIQFCLEPTYDCVQPEVIQTFDLSLSLEDLCSGVLREDVDTHASLRVFEDWTFQDILDDDYVFKIGDWLYLKLDVSSEMVSVEGVTLREVLFVDMEEEVISLYSKIGSSYQNTAFGETVGFVVHNDFEEADATKNSIGFHFMVHNEIAKLQPHEKKSFHVEVHTEVSYRGNEHVVVSRRNLGSVFVTDGITIEVVMNAGSSSGLVFPYIMLIICVTSTVFVFVAIMMGSVMIFVKRKKNVVVIY